MRDAKEKMAYIALDFDTKGHYGLSHVCPVSACNGEDTLGLSMLEDGMARICPICRGEVVGCQGKDQRPRAPLRRGECTYTAAFSKVYNGDESIHREGIYSLTWTHSPVRGLMASAKAGLSKLVFTRTTASNLPPWQCTFCSKTI